MSGPESSTSSEGSSLGRRLIDFLLKSRNVRLAIPSRFPGIALASPVDLLLMAILSAVSGTMVVMVITAGVNEDSDGLASLKLGLAFVCLLLLYRYTQSLLLRKSAAAIEDALHEQRVRVAVKVLRLDLGDIQQMSRSALLDGMARHYEAVSQAVMPLLSGFQNAILLALIIVYLFWQSLIAGVLTVIFVGLIIQYYLNREGELKEQLIGAARADAALRASAEDLVDGFKELRLSRPKQEAIYRDISALSAHVARCRTSGAAVISDLVILAGSTSYMLGATVVFILPLISDVMGTELSKIVTTELFLLGPLGAFVRAAEPLSIARFALAGIDAFERSLDDRAKPAQIASPQQFAFQRVHMGGVSYVHHHNLDEQGFAIRDITLDAAPGELIFVTGNNGSGKTTMLRVLTGLYEAQAGTITVNDTVVSELGMENYRNLFSTVFSDFHTFRKPYGLDEAGLATFMQNAEQLGIADKLPADIETGYDAGAFSTGQRKRLALALALAESRPILVLDEWAADQDPGYRERFYRTMLPRIKATGKAIIAVTHDERYFDLADRRYHMEDGQLKLVSST
ncbi:ATP-binding cassette domain-containing protein [Rhodopseudomonas sp. RCAM05734]|uniref:ATP-binding cassette domain-containing protein n=1 Tax=Rhodopseudomonas sp. RCAM05734 TaxID=3457549 RepID=UPI004043F8D0